jgi:orotate phosphoribosyltransferase
VGGEDAASPLDLQGAYAPCYNAPQNSHQLCMGGVRPTANEAQSQTSGGPMTPSLDCATQHGFAQLTDIIGKQQRGPTNRRSAERTVMTTKEHSLDNLWLAQILWDLGAVQFGDFTLSETTLNSPVFINPKKLVGNPLALRVASKLMQQEISLAQSLRRPRVQPFEVVAGVPVGGLLLATAYSLETNTPMIYGRPKPEGTGARGIEGQFEPGDTALIIDDLITKGSSVLDTASFLEEHGLRVKDVIVLIDREQGAAARLKHHGYNLLSILRLDVMLNHYMSQGLISEDLYRRCMEYTAANQAVI